MQLCRLTIFGHHLVPTGSLGTGGPLGFASLSFFCGHWWSLVPLSITSELLSRENEPFANAHVHAWNDAALRLRGLDSQAFT